MDAADGKRRSLYGRLPVREIAPLGRSQYKQQHMRKREIDACWSARSNAELQEDGGGRTNS
jgi:hypothetical protein